MNLLTPSQPLRSTGPSRRIAARIGGISLGATSVAGGPALLAQAILNDYLGFEVDTLVARVFMRDVVAHLASEFELDGHDVARWLTDRLAAALRAEASAAQ